MNILMVALLLDTRWMHHKKPLAGVLTTRAGVDMTVKSEHPMSEGQTFFAQLSIPPAMVSSTPWELSAITDQDLFFFSCILCFKT